MGSRPTQRPGHATAMRTAPGFFLKFRSGGAVLACGRLARRAGMGAPGQINRLPNSCS